MEELDKLKNMIDEYNYPYFTEEYLLAALEKVGSDANTTIETVAKRLLIKKSGIQEIKLGDVTIPSPRMYFLSLASSIGRKGSNAAGSSRMVTRLDEQ